MLTRRSEGHPARHRLRTVSGATLRAFAAVSTVVALVAFGVGGLVPDVAVAAPATGSATPTASDYKYAALPANYVPSQLQDDGSALANSYAVWRHGALTSLATPVQDGWSWVPNAADLEPDGTAYEFGYFYQDNPLGGGSYDYEAYVWPPDNYASQPTQIPMTNPDPTTGEGYTEYLLGVNSLGDRALEFTTRTPGLTGYAQVTGPGGADPRTVPGVISFGGLSDVGFLGYDANDVLGYYLLGSLAKVSLDFTPQVMSKNGWVAGVRADGTTYELRSPTGVETTIPVQASGIDEDGDVVAAGSGNSHAVYLPYGATAPVLFSSLVPTSASAGYSYIEQPTISPSGVLGGYLTNGDHNLGVGFELTPGAGQLTVSGISLSPAHPTVDDSSVTATVSVRNDYSTTVTSVVPTLTSSDATVLKVASGPVPGSTASLAADATTTFAYTLTPLQAQSVTLSATASATNDTGATVTTPTPDTLAVDLSTGDLTITVATDPAAPTVADTIDVSATLTNKTDLTLTGLTPSLAADPATGVTLGASTPASIATLAPHATTTVHWSMTATTAAKETLTVTVALTDPQSGPETDTGSATVTVNGPSFVVTTTGDQDDPAPALQRDVCDVDPNTDGDQCTLRAAIELANRLGGPEKISFDIPGATPTIAPASDLPATTAQVTVDGTTETGGWVILSGAADSAGTGLTVSGGDSTVAGLVVNGWATGIRLDGAGNDTVAGNRIGTNAAGTAAVPNGTGLRLLAPNSLVGQTSGGSTTVCDGGCNLISGNTTYGIDAQPSGTTAAGGSQIVGNVIGPNVTGTAAIAQTTGGIVVVSSPASWPTGTAPLVIGGSTPIAGQAPGNLISGNTWAVGATEADPSPGTSALVAKGNLIGANWSDTAPLPNAVGVVDSFNTWGGTGAGDANVIVFNTTGGAQGQAEMIGNDIGVSRSGVAQGNAIGVTDGTQLCADVISGNQVGVDGGVLQGGNRIGTDKAGETAIPNVIGVTGGSRTVPDAACTDTSVDLISGNTTAGVEMNVSFHGPEFSHAYIGTDLTGTRALPNGVGIRELSSADAGFLTLGGPSDSGTICNYPCVLVSGNRGAGISLAADAGGSAISIEFQNIGIGVGADGRPLGNGGSGILVNAPLAHLTSDATNWPAAALTGDVIANNGGPGVDLRGATLSPSFAITHSTVANNVGGGILFHDATGAAVENDSITGNSGPGVFADAGAAPELTGNGMSGNATGYQLGSGVSRTSAPIGVAVTRTGSNLTITGTLAGARPSSARIDVYGDTACTSTAQGAIPLAAVAVPAGLLNSTFTVTIPVPNAGGIELTTTDTSSSPGSTSSYSPCVSLGSVVPTLSRNPVAAGAPETISAPGFQPGENVQVTLHSAVYQLGTVIADANGTATITFTVPRDIDPGLHHVVFVGQSSGYSLSVPLTVTGAGTASLSASALAATGTDPSAALAFGVLAILGGALMLLRRRRGTRHRS